MPEVKYGEKLIEYTILERDDLKAHYITVEKHKGVVLKGKAVTEAQAQQLILKKARWILDKLELVRSVSEGAIVTGSRIPYLGRKYYAEVLYKEDHQGVAIEFNHSKFRIHVGQVLEVQPAIQKALEIFYRERAKEKIAPRVEKLSKRLKMPYQQLKLMKMEKRWGSCTERNNLILNTEAVKLPFTLIDYLIIHELCHTRVKDHSKAFWAELSRHLPNWKELDERMKGMKL